MFYRYTKEYLKSLKNNQAKVSSDILPTEIIVILVVLWFAVNKQTIFAALVTMHVYTIFF